MSTNRNETLEIETRHGDCTTQVMSKPLIIGIVKAKRRKPWIKLTLNIKVLKEFGKWKKKRWIREVGKYVN